MILNHMPRKKNVKNPYELWKGRKPSYKWMKLWGCLVKVQVPLPKKTKLGPKTNDCVYLGPAFNSTAYRFLVFKSNVDDINKNTIIESAETEFFERSSHKRRRKETPLSLVNDQFMTYTLTLIPTRVINQRPLRPPKFKKRLNQGKQEG